MIDENNIHKVHVGYHLDDKFFGREFPSLREAYDYINFSWEDTREFHEEILVEYRDRKMIPVEELEKHFMVKELNK